MDFWKLFVIIIVLGIPMFWLFSQLFFIFLPKEMKQKVNHGVYSGSSTYLKEEGFKTKKGYNRAVVLQWLFTIIGTAIAVYFLV